MGWSGGSTVVEPVIKYLASAMQGGFITPESATGMLETVIGTCQDAGWDTESEVLDDYRGTPWVVEAFRRREIYLTCDARTQAESTPGHTVQLLCTLPLGHTVDHRDEDFEIEWPVDGLCQATAVLESESDTDGPYREAVKCSLPWNHGLTADPGWHTGIYKMGSWFDEKEE